MYFTCTVCVHRISLLTCLRCLPYQSTIVSALEAQAELLASTPVLLHDVATRVTIGLKARHAVDLAAAARDMRHALKV